MTDTAVAPAVPEKTNEGDARQTIALSTPPAKPATPPKSDAPAAQKPATPPAPPAPGTPPKSDAPAPDAKAEKGDAKPAEQPEGVPESYAEFQFPEGTEAWGKGVVDVFSGAAKAAGLTQTQAQKFVESMAPAYQAKQKEHVEAAIGEWAEQSARDPEFGGAKLKASIDAIKPVYQSDEFTTPALRQLFKETGLEVHPEVIRLFHRLRLRVADDRVVNGGESEPVTGDIADPAVQKQILYKSKKK